jgi:hypothetical protein
VNDGGLVIATSKGHQMFPGDAKAIITSFLSSLDKPVKEEAKIVIDKPTVKKTIRKKPAKGIIPKKPKSE